MFCSARIHPGIDRDVARGGAFETRLVDVTNDRWVEVSGEGSVTATPDFARATLGVTTTGKEAREAMAANTKAATALVALIKSEGVSPADIQPRVCQSRRFS